MSALFNFHSFCTVVLLVICACTYLKMQFPAFLEQKNGFRGFFWKAARIGREHSVFLMARGARARVRSPWPRRTTSSVHCLSQSPVNPSLSSHILRSHRQSVLPLLLRKP